MITPEQVLQMAAHAEAADGVAPLDEATLLTLRHHPDQATVWGDYRGFGLLIGDELSLLVMPASRGTGLGRQLYLRTPSAATARTAWSHGDHPAAAALARSRGWDRARELWVMRLPQLAPMFTAGRTVAPGQPLGGGHGGRLTHFRAGDEAELLRVNAAAFAHHPEQGSLDADGLAERMAEPWFDPAGVIMAWDSSSPSSGPSSGPSTGSGTEGAERLLGFHWTKRHSETEGEVYVVAVDPAAQGRGLGKVLTVAGLEHLHATGAGAVHLYVEADNEAAVRLYSGLGFVRQATHVQYARV